MRIVAAVVLGFMVGCRSAPMASSFPTATVTQRPSPTATVTRPPTETPPPTSTATRTPAPAATATRPPTPTATAVPSHTPTAVPSIAPGLVALLGDQPTLFYRDMREEALYAWDAEAGRGHWLMDLSHLAGHLALSPAGDLAYTLEGVPYLVDLSAGTIQPIYTEQDHPNPDWDLCWSTDGRALAYSLAWNEADGSRKVELGTYDGGERRTVATLTARSGADAAHPDYAILAVLGYDRVARRILTTPAGGQERHSVVWAFDVDTGQQTPLLTFDDPEGVDGLVASPALAHLAVRLTPARIDIYDLAAPQTAPHTLAVPAGTYPGDLRWSPDGRWLAFLLLEGEAPGVAETSALGLWVLDTVKMQGQEILSLPRPDPPKLTSASLIGWHPDGKMLLLAWDGGSPRQRHVQAVDVDSGQATELALGEGTRPMGWIQRLRDA